MIHLFGHFIRTRSVLTAALELLLFFFAYFSGVALRFGGQQVELLPALSEPALIFPWLMIFSLAAVGHYQASTHDTPSTIISKVAFAWLIAIGMSSLLFYFMPETYVGRGVLALSSAIGFALVIALRLFLLRSGPVAIPKRRLLVLGTGESAAQIERTVNAYSPELEIVGFLPLNSTRQSVNPSKILPIGMSIRQAMRQLHAHEIVVAISERRDGGLPVNELLKCKMRGMNVTDFSAFFERQSGQVLLDSLSPSWLIFGQGFRRNFLTSVLKRVFDIVVSSLILLLMTPVLLLTVTLIKLESPGPVFYSQVRVGRGGRNFVIYKLRSMCQNAEHANAPQWAQKNDHRITRIGRLIRITRIDELPQLINVLRGEMSVVGPRPERPFFVKMLTEKIPLYNARHYVKPGLTGWAQVRYSYGATVQDAKEKLQYDLYYIKNQSIFLDFLTLFETIQVVLWARGAR